jgi:hypothetical protein
MRRAAAIFTSSHPPRLDSGPAGDPAEGWGPYRRGGACWSGEDLLLWWMSDTSSEHSYLACLQKGLLPM